MPKLERKREGKGLTPSSSEVQTANSSSVTHLTGQAPLVGSGLVESQLVYKISRQEAGV
jgi:hypothetical protein